MLPADGAVPEQRLSIQSKLRLRIFIAFVVLVGFVFTVVYVPGQFYAQLDSFEDSARRRLQEEISATKPKKGKKAKGNTVPKPKQGKLQKSQRICDHADFPNTTLQLETEKHMSSLFSNLKGKENRFEGSDVILLNSSYYVVYDNLYSVGKIDVDLFSTSKNRLLPYAQKISGSSGYEGIAYDEVGHHYYLVVESEQGASPTSHHGVIEQVQLHETSQTYSLMQRCESEHVFPITNKGFEGAAIVRVKRNMYLLALCEGNYCDGGTKGKQAGNGRILVLQRRPGTPSAPCLWRTVREISLPSVAMFQDYSALALRRTNVSNQFDIAVTSQENSQLWVGQLTIGQRLDLLDWQLTAGSVFNFPRDEDCGLMFCSIEGIGFLDGNKFVAVSDKGGGTARGCAAHDESIHIFKLP